MSDKPAVFQGSYADLRFIKGRKVAAITVEIPIEAAAAFVDVFGAPNPAAEIPVVLARLAPEVTRSSGNVFADLGLPDATDLKTNADNQVRERKAWADLPPSQQSAIRCDEPAFRQFLSQVYRYAAVDKDGAAEAIRQICGVGSRAELNFASAGTKRWLHLDDEFFKWQRGAR